MITCPKYDQDEWPEQIFADSPEEPDRKLIETCIRKGNKWLDIAMKLVTCPNYLMCI